MTSKLSTDSSMLLQLDSTMASVSNTDDFKRELTKKRFVDEEDEEEEDQEMKEGEAAAEAPDSYLSTLKHCFEKVSFEDNLNQARESDDPLLRNSSSNPMCQTLN